MPGHHFVDDGDEGDDGEVTVRRVQPYEATKTYRCPGCDQEIAPGTPHVVAWAADGINIGIDERRHWHRACWQHRLRRGPSRGARRTDT